LSLELIVGLLLALSTMNGMLSTPRSAIHAPLPVYNRYTQCFFVKKIGAGTHKIDAVLI